MIKEYRTIQEVNGPLMVVRRVSGVTYDELGEIELPDGTVRRCQVLEVNGDNAVVQLFESSAGINLAESKVRFLGHPLQLGVSGDMLGRVFNGMGKPIDGGPEILAEEYRDINGLPMNPAARDYPNEFIQTGISTIDGLNTLVRGQKLPIFSGSGLPHAALAAQIARQAKVLDGESNFAVVFAAIGITFEESEFFVSEFKRTGAIDRTVLFTNLANDPAVERIATPRMALTAAEYLAFEKGMHVLVIMTDITNYAEALREISGRLEEMPAEEGFPAYLASRLAEFYERAGYVKTLEGKEGSVTVIGAVSPQGGDFSEPVTQNTKRYVRTFWGLDRALAYARHFPSINWLTSYSEYADDLRPWYDEHVGPEFVTCRHQMAHLLQKESELMEIVKLIGADILPEDQKLIIETAKLFRVGFLQQNAYHAIDTYVPLDKQLRMMELMLKLYHGAKDIVSRAIPLSQLKETGIFESLAKMKYEVPNDGQEKFAEYDAAIEDALRQVNEANR